MKFMIFKNYLKVFLLYLFFPVTSNFISVTGLHFCEEQYQTETLKCNKFKLQVSQDLLTGYGHGTCKLLYSDKKIILTLPFSISDKEIYFHTSLWCLRPS